MRIIPVFIYIIICCLLYKTAAQDKEYKSLANREILFQRRDNIEIIVLSVLWCVYIFTQHGITPYLCSIALPYLTIAEVCDRLTKMVYVTPYYIFITILLIIDFSGVLSTPRTGVLFIILFTVIMEKMHLVGGGDAGMIAVIGVIDYISHKNTAEALLMMCFMILIGSVMQYVVAMKKHNMDGFFKMKEPMAFGPSLTYATLIMLGIRMFL